MSKKTAVRIPCFFLTILATICLGEAARAGEWVSQVRQGHPRLMLLDADLPALQAGIKADPVRAKWYQSVRKSAENLLTAPVVAYPHDKYGNTLGSCRQCVDRIYRLGLVYRLEHDARFAKRAIDELMTASALDDWDPKHFLDTAELTHAVAIGYDWFYQALTPDQRAVIRTALREKGLKQGLAFYESPHLVLPKYLNFNWALYSHNWNQVCNGGMTIGALALADEEPDLSEHILSAALKSVRLAMAEFAPDGGWGEGPGYWDYATSYNVYMLAALESAIGPGVIEPYLKMPGFDKTGDFRIHVVGPSNQTFNFADSHEAAGGAAQMFWLAKKFNRPVYAWHAARLDPPSPLDVIWYTPDQKSPQETGLPLDAYFRHVETVFLRGAWGDEKAVYVGFKGGNNAVNHGHLDLGTFVFDADGCRWALDLGRDNYALPGYFIVGKITYYRLKTIGHNTLVFDDDAPPRRHDQRSTAKAPIVKFRSTPALAFAVADLSDAYYMPKGNVRRGMALLDRRNLLIKDEIRCDKPCNVAWQMHTRATAAIDGPTATLRQGDKVLTARIVEPEGAVFEWLPADPPPPEAQQPDVHKLVIRSALPVGDSRITVMLCPGNAVTVPQLAAKPLEAW